MVEIGSIAPALTLFLWSASVTPLFLSIQEFRQRNLGWGGLYLGLTCAMVLLGFFWPGLPSVATKILSARSDEIFVWGSMGWSVVYAIARRRWVVHADRRLISGVGEGIAVYVFASLVLLPFLSDGAIVEIFSRRGNKFIFVLGGISGLILVAIDSMNRESKALAKTEENSEL